MVSAGLRVHGGRVRNAQGSRGARNGHPTQTNGAPNLKPMPAVQVMTFNLRYATQTPPHSWPQRRPVISELLRQCAPDIIGTQEGFHFALEDIALDRPEFSWVGTGRDGGGNGEHAAIFFRRDRFEMLEHEDFWLSDTPGVEASRSWGNRCVRMATWIRLREAESGRELVVCNTHLDHESQLARERGAALIAEKMNELPTDSLLILTGDFNAQARGNRAYDILIDAGFSDAWFEASERNGPDFASFHGYQKPVRGAHIDWILTRGAVKSKSARLVDFGSNGQMPSDHFPVMATLEFHP